jgi:hypothetical protein
MEKKEGDKKKYFESVSSCFGCWLGREGMAVYESSKNEIKTRRKGKWEKAGEGKNDRQTQRS